MHVHKLINESFAVKINVKAEQGSHCLPGWNEHLNDSVCVCVSK